MLYCHLYCTGLLSVLFCIVLYNVKPYTVITKLGHKTGECVFTLLGNIDRTVPVIFMTMNNYVFKLENMLKSHALNLSSSLTPRLDFVSKAKSHFSLSKKYIFTNFDNRILERLVSSLGIFIFPPEYWVIRKIINFPQSNQGQSI